MNVTDGETPIVERGDIVCGLSQSGARTMLGRGSLSRITKAVRSTASSILRPR